MRTQGVADRQQFLDATGACGPDAVAAFVENFGDESSLRVIELAEHILAKR
jgi:hypothetical protein